MHIFQGEQKNRGDKGTKIEERERENEKVDLAWKARGRPTGRDRQVDGAAWLLHFTL